MTARPAPEVLADWRRWLDENSDDPALLAGCARLGVILGGGGR